MRTFHIVVCLLLVASFSVSEMQAQSRKKLKARIAELEGENALLTTQNNDLASRVKTLEDRNSSLEGQVVTMEGTVSRMKTDSIFMSTNYELLKIDYDALASGELDDEEDAGSPTSGGINTPVDPNDTRDCAVKQNTLQVNNTYTLNLLKLNSKGYGIQVYTYKDLCSAIDRANEFRKFYKMYNTYIRVKQRGGQRLYCVIYASFKDQQQARIYCNNFRKIAKDPVAKGAFVVPHEPGK